MRIKIITTIGLLLIGSVAYCQDTTSVPVKQGDPAVRETPRETQQNMLRDMVKITAVQAPEGVKQAVQSDDYKGTKIFYKHKKKDEYAVEVQNGEISSFHFFDKEGKSINQRE